MSQIIRQRHGTNGTGIIADAESITISGRGNAVEKDLCDGVRNNTTLAGDIAVVLDNDDSTYHTFKAVPAGEAVYARIKRVLETSDKGNTSLSTVEKFWLE